MSIICPVCNMENGDKANICVSCGTPMAGRDDSFEEVAKTPASEFIIKCRNCYHVHYVPKESSCIDKCVNCGDDSNLSPVERVPSVPVPVPVPAPSAPATMSTGNAKRQQKTQPQEQGAADTQPEKHTEAKTQKAAGAYDTAMPVLELHDMDSDKVITVCGSGTIGRCGTIEQEWFAAYPQISREHCKIIFSGDTGCYSVKHLSTTQDTAVNGETIGTSLPRRLKNGYKLSLVDKKSRYVIKRFLVRV